MDPAQLLRPEEEIEHAGIEVRAALGEEDLGGVLERHRRPVRPLVGQGVEAVGNRGDAPRHGYRLPGQPVRVAAAVVPLVVGERDERGETEQLALGLGEDRVPGTAVLLHDEAFLVGERALLEQDGVRDGDLADIVQPCGEPDRVRLVVEPEPVRRSARSSCSSARRGRR